MPTLIKTLLAVCFYCATSLSYGAEISQQQAAQIAQQAFSGRVLSIKLSGNHYRVKLLNSKGQVRIISVDANSGKTR